MDTCLLSQSDAIQLNDALQQLQTLFNQANKQETTQSNKAQHTKVAAASKADPNISQAKSDRDVDSDEDIDSPKQTNAASQDDATTDKPIAALDVDELALVSKLFIILDALHIGGLRMKQIISDNRVSSPLMLRVFYS